MRPSPSKAAAFAAMLLFCFGTVLSSVSYGQSRPQKTEKTGDGKKNSRPTEEELKKQEEEKKRAEEEKNAIIDTTVERIETKGVTVNAVVYNKKTGQVITGLKRGNFAVFENGVKQPIS